MEGGGGGGGGGGGLCASYRHLLPSKLQTAVVHNRASPGLHVLHEK